MKLVLILSLMLLAACQKKEKCENHFQVAELPVLPQEVLDGHAAEKMQEKCGEDFIVDSITEEGKYIIYRYTCPQMCK